MNQFFLTNKIKVTGKLKSTSAKLFKNVKPGDELSFYYTFISDCLSGRTANIQVESSFNQTLENNATQLKRNLSNFSFIPEFTLNNLIFNNESKEITESPSFYLNLEFSLFGEFEVKQIIKKTNAEFFRDLNEGDVFLIELPMNCNGVSQISFYRNGEKLHSEYASKLQKTFKTFEFKQLR